MVVTFPPTCTAPVAFVVSDPSACVHPTSPVKVVVPFELTANVRPAALPFTVLPKVTFPPVPNPALPPVAVRVVLAESRAASAIEMAPPVPAVPLPNRFPPVAVMF